MIAAFLIEGALPDFATGLPGTLAHDRLRGRPSRSARGPDQILHRPGSPGAVGAAPIPPRLAPASHHLAATILRPLL